MKRFFLIVCLLASVSAGFAQTQQGYVKTRGRLSVNGTAIPGTRLSGVTITFRGNKSAVSGTNGAFTFAVSNKTFCITNVRKNGYQLYDSDLLGRDHRCSSNDLWVVMDTPDNVLTDRLESEKKIRRTLRRQLQDKENEIEALKEQQKITEEQYRKQLQELYAAQEKNEKLITEMAERYSTLDFDQMDDLQRRITAYIQNGELFHADSLLKTKGNMEERLAHLVQNGTIIAANAEDLRKRQKTQERSEALHAKELADFAIDCFSRYEICKIQYKNDSAAYYLKMRADLDSTNVKWNLNYADFCRIYLEKYEEAEKYIQRTLRQTVRAQSVADQIECYNTLAIIESSRANYQQALAYIDNEEKLMLGNNLYDIEANVVVATGRGNIYRKDGKYELAERYLRKAVTLIENKSDSVSIQLLAKAMGNYANFCISIERYQDALDVYLKMMPLIESQDSVTTPIIITTETNIGNAYYLLGQYEEALIWLEKSLKHAREQYGNIHSAVSSSLNNIGAVYMRRKETDKALDIVGEAIKIEEELYGNKSERRIISINNLAKLLVDKNMYDAAMEEYNKALEICKLYYENNHPYFGTLFSNIASLYCQQGKYAKSMEYFQKALDIRIEKLGEQSVGVAIIYFNMGTTYYRMEQKIKAKECLNKAYIIFESRLGADHPNTKLTQEHILEMTQEEQ